VDVDVDEQDQAGRSVGSAMSYVAAAAAAAFCDNK